MVLNFSAGVRADRTEKGIESGKYGTQESLGNPHNFLVSRFHFLFSPFLIHFTLRRRNSRSLFLSRLLLPTPLSPPPICRCQDKNRNLRYLHSADNRH